VIDTDSKTFRRRDRLADRPRIAHVGIAVPDLDAALSFYRDVLGLVPHPPEQADGATIVSLPFGDSEVELLSPLVPESPVAKFLERRGPGIHHICYRVPDLDAALAACRSAGYRLVDDIPRTGAGGRRIAFVHPKATAGILLELTE
jgi:methylmalonyl-CoA/ethylmalonyl-CoA epimerase